MESIQHQGAVSIGRLNLNSFLQKLTFGFHRPRWTLCLKAFFIFSCTFLTIFRTSDSLTSTAKHLLWCWIDALLKEVSHFWFCYDDNFFLFGEIWWASHRPYNPRAKLWTVLSGISYWRSLCCSEASGWVRVAFSVLQQAVRVRRCPIPVLRSGAVCSMHSLSERHGCVSRVRPPGRTSGGTSTCATCDTGSARIHQNAIDSGSSPQTVPGLPGNPRLPYMQYPKAKPFLKLSILPVL